MTAATKRECPLCGGSGMRKDGLITVGPITLVPLTGEVVVYDRRIALSRRLAQLLALLMERAGRPVSRKEILRIVWRGKTVCSNMVPVYINYLRNKRLVAFIKTVPGKGYMFSAEDG